MEDRPGTEAIERFEAAVSAPEVALDVAAFCIAACAHPRLDVDAACAELDTIARSCPDESFEGLRAHLFGTLGFAGNTGDYGDPENSFLDSVVARRTGIPITLAVLMIEVGRRIGVPVDGVGMPGHFLVADPRAVGSWCDVFDGGVRCGFEECRALYSRVHGPNAPFSAALLAPVSARSILARMLTNLEHGRLAADPRHLEWMCTLHGALPDLGAAEIERLAVVHRVVRARWN